MGYGHFKDLLRKTASDKVLCEKAFNIAKSSTKHDGYHRDLTPMIYKFFYKKSSSSINSDTCANKLAGGAVKSKIKRNQELTK